MVRIECYDKKVLAAAMRKAAELVEDPSVEALGIEELIYELYSNILITKDIVESESESPDEYPFFI